MEEDIVYKYTEKVIKQIVKKDDEYTRKMIKEYVKTKYPNEKVRIDFYDEETIDKIIDLGINALNSEKTVHTCSHCGENTPLYCENCYQELISKNAELQLENNQLKRKIFDLYNSSGEYEKAKCIMTKELRDYIPKQVIRAKIQLLEKELKLLDKNDKHTIIENDYIISVLKELLGE